MEFYESNLFYALLYFIFRLKNACDQVNINTKAYA